MALDRMLPGNYYTLYFMRDYGTDRGPCIALYGTVRSRTRDPRFCGLFLKFQLYGVHFDDPAQWYTLYESRPLGEVSLWDWVPPGDSPSRL